MSHGSLDLVSVPISAFLRGLPIRVDSFIALNDDKHVMVFKAGTPVDLERIQEYREKKLKHLHVRRADCRVFFDGQLLMAHKALVHPNLVLDQKLQFLNLAHHVLMTKLEVFGFDAESFEAAKWCAKSVLSVVASEPKLAQILERFQTVSEMGYHHSMAVAAVAAVLGRSLGWTRPDTMEKLVLGAILHDIGLMRLPEGLRNKPMSEMTLSQQAHYMSHVGHGAEMLARVPAVPSDVIAIVRQHHELSNGTGYPQALRDLKINPLARVVALADQFCELFHSDADGGTRSAHEVLTHIESAMGQPFNRDAFKKLKTLFAA